MIRSMWSAITGMKGQQLNMDVISNNLANVNTYGFKKSTVDFATLLSQTLRAAGTEIAAGQQIPTGIEVGLGSKPVAVTKRFSQGAFQPTDNPLDLAIDGKGFFAIQQPDGSTAYTRAGAFKLDSNGNVVTSEGFFLLPQTTIAASAIEVTIGEDGTISTIDNTGSSTSVGTLSTYIFPNPSGLKADGRNLYVETTASGTAVAGTPGANGYGKVIQGFLESSNVQVVEEMVNMIVAQRAFELNSKGIKAADEMLNVASRLK